MLAAAGQLQGRRVATHRGWVERLRQRQLVMFIKRAGGQSQSTLAAQAHDEANFAALHAWIASHLDDNLDVAACRALESSTRPLKAICRKVGYAEEQTLRRVFLRNVGVHPLQYRARFSERAGV
ncbi:hypothetical protein [Massilia aquatica]|uniref:HTH araC/xylS-type domain-containing protein n=1 Tax=Massilia aquatica TaxID=2609000 RepID=A0ABX0M8E8_9BURK|nr:hypothetical protein [Massilia aquatica]NHZ43475.1 hypothetical protein [Massilia aquatica]